MQGTRWSKLTDRPPAITCVLKAAGRWKEGGKPWPSPLRFYGDFQETPEQFYENLVTEPQLDSICIFIYISYSYVEGFQAVTCPDKNRGSGKNHNFATNMVKIDLDRYHQRMLNPGRTVCCRAEHSYGLKVFPHRLLIGHKGRNGDQKNGVTRQHPDWVIEMNITNEEQADVMWPPDVTLWRTQHCICGIPAGHAEPESNYEKTSDKPKLRNGP